MKKALAVILIFILTAAFPAIALAADISVNADSTEVTVGDTVTVTVKVSGDDIAVADGVFTYDPAVLSYISSNGGASDGYINLVSLQKGGSSSLTAIIKFAAIGEGEAVINVQLGSVLDYDGNSLGGAQAGVSITVEPDGQAAEPDTDAAPALDLSQTGVAATNVLGTEAQMYIWRSLRNVSLPSGYVDWQVTYGDEFVGGAAIPDSEDLLLLYLSEADGQNAGYYIYDEEKDVLFPYRTVTSISAKFTIIWPDESLGIPQGFEETTVEVNEMMMPAWAAPDSDGTVYLVYVRSGSGEKDFYLYNTVDKSLQRYLELELKEPEPEPAPTPTPKPTPEPTAEPVSAPVEEPDDSITMQPFVLIALIAVCGLFAIAAVVLAVLFGRSKKQLKKQKGSGVRVKRADF